MFNFKTTKQFERDYRLMVRQGKNIGQLKGVMNTLVCQKPLESRHCAMPLPVTGRGTETAMLNRIGY